MVSRKTRNHRGALSVCAFVALALFQSQAKGVDSGFFIEKLPVGSEVTLPQPATTYVSLNTRVTVAATDSPQTLRIMPVNIGGGMVTEFRVAISDDGTQEHIRYFDIKPGLPFLYNFRKLSTIAITVDAQQAARLPSTLRMRMESDKPLSIRR